MGAMKRLYTARALERDADESKQAENHLASIPQESNQEGKPRILAERSDGLPGYELRRIVRFGGFPL